MNSFTATDSTGIPCKKNETVSCYGKRNGQVSFPYKSVFVVLQEKWAEFSICLQVQCGFSIRFLYLSNSACGIYTRVLAF